MNKNQVGQMGLPDALLTSLEETRTDQEGDSTLPSGIIVPTSLDTLQLWTDKFSHPVRWELPFRVSWKEGKKSGALFINGDGNVVSGSEAHAQVGPIHIRLGLLPYCPSTHLTVTFNPAEVLWGNNVRSVSREDCRRAVNEAHTILNSRGIRVRMETMLPQRLDWRRDYSVQHEVDHYIPYFKSVRPASCNRDITYCYKTAICFGWEKERARFYDKTKHIQSELTNTKVHKHVSPEERNLKIQRLKGAYNEIREKGKNVLRAEYEVHPDAPLRRKQGFNTLADVLDNYDNGARVFDEFFSKKIFVKPPNKNVVLNTSLYYMQNGREMQLGASHVPNENLECFLMAMGAYRYQQLAPENYFCDALKKRDMSRSQMSTLKNKLERGRPYVQLRSGVTFREIEEELEALFFPYGRPCGPQK